MADPFGGNWNEQELRQHSISKMDMDRMCRVLRIIAIEHPRVFTRAVNQEYLVTQVMEAEKQE